MAGTISGSKTEVRQSYIPALRPRLIAPLAARGGDGVEEVLELLDTYGMSKDDFDAVMELELLSGPNAKAAMSSVSTAAKSALTRKYNAAHAEPKQHKARKGGGGDKVTRFTEDGEEEADGADDSEDAMDDDDDFVKPTAKPSAKAAPKNKGKGKAKA